VITSVEEGFIYLESFLNLERADFKPRMLRLSRMRDLLSDFNNPHLSYRTLHVAGSKGKGSTSAFAASILHASGLRTGLYTSPHVVSYRERVQVTDGCASDELQIEQFERIRRYIGTLRSTVREQELPTTFELLTLFAFLLFEAARCDAAVIEVGLGGRLDATSLVCPQASLITRIELEHTEFLGNTIRSIASEKGAIIKRGIPVFVSQQRDEAMRVFDRIAELRKAPLHRFTAEDALGVSITRAGTRARMALPGHDSIEVTLRLLGRVQAQNAALAAWATLEVFPEVNERTVATGLEAAWLPGRSEIIRRKNEQSVLLDGAHTEASVALLCETVESLFPDKDQRIVIFGSVRGKAYRAMLDRMHETFASVVICRPGEFKPSDPELLLEACREAGSDCVRIDEANDAIAYAQRRLPRTGGVIVVTGSFYLVGKIRRELLNESAAGLQVQPLSGSSKDAAECH
jgi:dihydrofolate synthase/folylpolyglutamate synthase